MDSGMKNGSTPIGLDWIGATHTQIYSATMRFQRLNFNDAVSKPNDKNEDQNKKKTKI